LRRAAAFHEAGHGLLAVLTGYRLISLSIDLDGEGHMRSDRWPSSCVTVGEIAAQLLCWSAGIAGECVARGGKRVSSSEAMRQAVPAGDLALLANCLTRHQLPNRAEPERLAIRCALTIVGSDAAAPFMHAVSGELLVRGELDGTVTSDEWDQGKYGDQQQVYRVYLQQLLKFDMLAVRQGWGCRTAALHPSTQPSLAAEKRKVSSGGRSTR
jgi:hypothetical protein